MKNANKPTNLPAGTAFEQHANGFVATATTRSGEAIIFVPMTGLWLAFSSIVLYPNEFHGGKFTLGAPLLVLPFLTVAVLLCSHTLMRLAGRVSVVRDGDEGLVFTGFGPFGFTRRFRWSEVRTITDCEPPFWTKRPSFDRRIQIALASGGSTRFIKFGSLLSRQRLEFMITVLQSQCGAGLPAWP